MESLPAISIAIHSQFEQQVAFFQRLVQAKSVNPFTPDHSPPDAPVEQQVAAVIRDELDRLGFPVESYGVSQERQNILSMLSGSGNISKTLILTTHMDTVEPSGYARDPWGAQIEHGRLYGVGSADAKAQIAAFLYAAHAIKTVGMPLVGRLKLAFVVDEESGACSPYGTQYLLKQGLLQGDAAIIGEPGNSKIAIGHRGLYRFRIQTQGEAVHTGMKEWEQRTRGKNAILDMARIAQALSTTHLPSPPSAAFPGRTSVLTFPTLIHGGSGMNVVPGFCEAYGDVRLLPGITANDVRERILEKIEPLLIHSYQLEDILFIPSVETDPSTEIVQVLSQSVERITGDRPLLAGSGPACDGWMFIKQGIPTICGYGVTCGGVHGADEWVDLESLHTVTNIYAHTIARYLGA